jgi:hypothetical protein
VVAVRTVDVTVIVVVMTHIMAVIVVMIAVGSVHVFFLFLVRHDLCSFRDGDVPAQDLTAAISRCRRT